MVIKVPNFEIKKILDDLDQTILWTIQLIY